MSEWYPGQVFFWGDPLKYTEAAGGGWAAGERTAVGAMAASLLVIARVPEGIAYVGRESFRRGGWLNNNPYIRVGMGWKGPAIGGKPVFRVSIGNKRFPIYGHIDIWPEFDASFDINWNKR